MNSGVLEGLPAPEICNSSVIRMLYTLKCKCMYLFLDQIEVEEGKLIKGYNKYECLSFPFQVEMSDYQNMDTNNIISTMKMLHEQLTILFK